MDKASKEYLNRTQFTDFYLRLLNDEWFASLAVVVCGTGILLGYFAYLFIG